MTSVDNRVAHSVIQVIARPVDELRCVVVKLPDENAWIACSMQQTTWDIIGEEDWQRWRQEMLDMVLADWREYEIREVVVRVPQSDLDALFDSGPIDAEVAA